VFVSSDGTTLTSPTFGDTFGYAVAVDPTSAAVAYAGLGNGAYKTTDHGATWTKLTGIGSFNGMAIDPTNTQNLYAGNGAVFHSTNGGTSWTQMTNGLPSAVNYTVFAIDPKTPATVYVGAATSGFYRSTNGGESWSLLGLAGMTPLAVSIDPTTPTTMYVGVKAGGLYKTTTGGL
jgi:photosystem II stability/assembly factor-like uncharacterized protein